MTRRPSFPARVEALASSSDASKKIANNVHLTGAKAENGLKNTSQTATQAAPAVMPLRGPGDFQRARARLVALIVQQGVQLPQVLQAIGAVERHRFVDTALVNQAYEDTSLPIGLGQTISKPGVVARMIELLLGATQEGVAADAPRLGRVLEIGTGCGYQAAVLSHVAREVYSIERLRGLHEKARANLRAFRLANVHLLLGDGMAGFPKGAPYAGIIAAAGGEAVPAAWVEQLAVGGRIVAPMGTGGGQQALVVIDKTRHGVQQRVLEAVHFVPLKSGVV